MSSLLRLTSHGSSLSNVRVIPNMHLLIANPSDRQEEEWGQILCPKKSFVEEIIVLQHCGIITACLSVTSNSMALQDLMDFPLRGSLDLVQKARTFQNLEEPIL